MSRTRGEDGTRARNGARGGAGSSVQSSVGSSVGHRRRRLAIALVVLAALLIGTGLVERSSTADDLRAAKAGQRHDEQELADTTAQLSAVRRMVDVIRGNRDRDQSAADTAADADSDLAELRAQMAAGQATLAASDAQLGQQTGQVAALASCVATLDHARDQLSADQVGAATAALRDGTASCQFAEAIVKGPATAGFPYDFADPYVMPVTDGYLAFGTNGPGGTVQMLSSTDSVSWKLEGSALTGLPPWADPGHTWAPSVVGTLDGYLLLYTVRDRVTKKQCISTARSAQPMGPYVDTSAGPFICQPQLGGSIDPSPTVVFGSGAYVLWKSEGESVHSVSRIWSQQFDPETLTLMGDPAVLLSADRSWESGVIEGPSMTFVDGTWMLIYSGNHWGEPDYAVGYATCDSPMGPCRKPADNVVLSSSDAAAGPGGAEFFHALDGSIGVAFAGWSPDSIGWPSPRRLYVRHVWPAPPGRLAIG